MHRDADRAIARLNINPRVESKIATRKSSGQYLETVVEAFDRESERLLASRVVSGHVTFGNRASGLRTGVRAFVDRRTDDGDVERVLALLSVRGTSCMVAMLPYGVGMRVSEYDQ